MCNIQVSGSASPSNNPQSNTQALHAVKPTWVGSGMRIIAEYWDGFPAISGGGMQVEITESRSTESSPRAGLHHPELRVSAPYDNTTCRSRPGVPRRGEWLSCVPKGSLKTCRREKSTYVSVRGSLVTSASRYQKGSMLFFSSFGLHGVFWC